MSTPKDLLSYDRAREILGVSDKKLRKLLKDGLLTAYSSPLDARRKFISRGEIEQLMEHWKVAA
jgi:hypothetical protein